MVDERRVRSLNDRPVGIGPVVYWMQRDQRANDNWALLYAKEQAEMRKVPLVVLFNLEIISHRANLRQYDFMLRGLAEVSLSLEKLSIPFFLLEGVCAESVTAFVKKYKIGEVVTDFSPLHYTRLRRVSVSQTLPVRVTEVDAHNIIPCWMASDKEEFAAYTFRPKVHRTLSTYLTEFPTLKANRFAFEAIPKAVDIDFLLKKLPLDRTILPVTNITPGTKSAEKCLKSFLKERLETYHIDRNDPTKNGVSGLSPYLHFGQLSAQRVAIEVSKVKIAPKEAREAYLEELVVRRELADNYCFYNKAYDTVAGAHAWAQKSISEHVRDEREYLYSKEDLEQGRTHDDLWNAMQQQMVQDGKMHGWCRMYWAKKILEWTPNTQTAIDIALYLNDAYELDGNDPNGVTGVMWSICGVHDRAWGNRAVFGKIRYMNYAGAKRKFDIKAYIQRYNAKNTLFK